MLETMAPLAGEVTLLLVVRPGEASEFCKRPVIMSFKNCSVVFALFFFGGSTMLKLDCFFVALRFFALPLVVAGDPSSDDWDAMNINITNEH